MSGIGSWHGATKNKPAASASAPARAGLELADASCCAPLARQTRTRNRLFSNPQIAAYRGILSRPDCEPLARLTLLPRHTAFGGRTLTR